MLCGFFVLVVRACGNKLCVYRDGEGLECADDIVEERET
jgi:hypothetical protein